MQQHEGCRRHRFAHKLLLSAISEHSSAGMIASTDQLTMGDVKRINYRDDEIDDRG